MKPLNGYIQIEFKEPEEITSSGIILPEQAKDKTEEGKIVHAGESAFEVGTMVLFKNYCLEEFELDSKKKLWFVKAEHVIAAYSPEHSLE